MVYYGNHYGRNGHEYKVFIVSPKSGVPDEELTMSAQGIELKYSGDLFDEIKGIGATINVLTEELPIDIWSSKPTAVRVVVQDDGETMWEGYVTPNAYSQDFKPGKCSLQVECRDTIAVLKDIKYTNPNGLTEDSIYHYIVRAVAVGNDTTEELAEAMIDLTEPFGVSLKNLYVQDSNWYDEDNEPMQWYEVLQHLLRYCGCYILQWRGRVQVIDVRAQEVTTDIDEVSVDLTPSISLTDVVQKVKVVDSLYGGSVEMVDWTDDAKFEASGGDTAYCGHILAEGSIEAMSELAFFSNQYYTQYLYDKDTLTAMDFANNVGAMKSGRGAFLIKAFNDAFNTDEEPKSTSDFKPYIVATLNESSSTVGNRAYEKLPILKISDPNAHIYTRSDVLIVKANVLYNQDMAMLINDNNKGGYRFYAGGPSIYKGTLECEQDVVVEPDALYLELQIKIGNWYAKMPDDYTKDFGYCEWVLEPTTVKCYLSRSSCKNDPGTGFKNFLNANLSLRNNISWTYGINESGFGLQMKPYVHGKLEVTLMGVHTPKFNNKGEYPLNSVWISDFNITVGKMKGYLAEEMREHDDTYYENVIDENNSLEGKDVQLKVCTDDGFSYNRAAVYNLDGSTWSYQEKLRSRVTNEMLLAEEHIVNKRVQQYAQPRRVLTGNWRKFVAEPTEGVKSTVLDCNFRLTDATINLASSETEMTIEEIL